MSTYRKNLLDVRSGAGSFGVVPVSRRLFQNRDARARGRSQGQDGLALLAVLWLAVALTMIGMTTAAMVRGASDQVSNHLDSERSYFLARGGIDNAIYSIIHSTGQPAQSAEGPEDPAGAFSPGERWLRFRFDDGTAEVQVAPENAKLNLNQASADQLAALFTLLGEPSDASGDEAAAIVDWRSPQASLPSSFDQFYAALSPPYAARHSAFSDLNEMLAVKGMSGDLFYGRLTETSQGAWRRLPPLGDLLTAQTGVFGINVNYAEEQVLEVLPGWNQDMAQAVVQVRDAKPFASLDELLAAVPEVTGYQAMAQITLALPSVYTLTSTAWVSGSPVRRTVRALVRLNPQLPLGYRVLAWWSDWPWSEAPPAYPDSAASGGPQI